MYGHFKKTDHWNRSENSLDLGVWREFDSVFMGQIILWCSGVRQAFRKMANDVLRSSLHLTWLITWLWTSYWAWMRKPAAYNHESSRFSIACKRTEQLFSWEMGTELFIELLFSNSQNWLHKCVLNKSEPLCELVIRHFLKNVC